MFQTSIGYIIFQSVFQIDRVANVLFRYQDVHGFVSMLFNLSRQISNETGKPAKTSQRFAAVQYVFSLKPKFTVLFQKYTLLLKAHKHCATDGSI